MDTAIAVIGMSCRFPGARNPEEYWELLKNGREARTTLDDAELLAAGVPAQALDDPHYVKSGMFLDEMELFDAQFFGFSANDAAVLDPQHRHFLECSWAALEHAGYNPRGYPGSVGVFAGSGYNAYMPFNLLTNPAVMDEMGFFLVRHTGNDKDFLSTRVSYLLDLTGPSVNVATACSTSLVAVHLAAQSLLTEECDLALAGGVTITLPHRQGYFFRDGEILAPDGHCRPFDARAAGTVFGSGVGVVVLKRLQDALEDRDNVLAIIRGTAINNDGATKVSYLSPSVDGQAACIAEALEVADIDPATVTMVEAHGTGTAIGDPIEVAALSEAYAADDTQFCALGSVKANIGHTDTAAGIASMIKVILAMNHGQIPPSINYESPNAEIDFEHSPFYVNDALRDWAPAGSPRRAGVSSLGVGGTNAHLLLEQAPEPDRAQESAAGRHQVIVLSARSRLALDDLREALAVQLETTKQNLGDVAWTLQHGRAAFDHRFSCAVSSVEQAVRQLRDDADDHYRPTDTGGRTRQPAFMFAGGGAQYPNMGKHLYATEPVYRDALDECLRVLRGTLDFDLREVLFPPEGREEQAALELQRPTRSLPSLFATQYAQAKLWESWGITPRAMIGHSMGENTAACLAGVFSLADALQLVSLRGRLFERTERGGMLSVAADVETARGYLSADLSLACINAPGTCVLSGPVAAIESLAGRLTEDGVAFSRVLIEVAAHSALLEPILDEFGDFLRGLRLSAPSVPIYSNLTGELLTDAHATNPDYWVQHLRQTVRFESGMSALLREPDVALLEIGPGRTLASLAGMNSGAGDTPIVVSMPHPSEDVGSDEFMAAAIGRLWQAGVPIDWARIDDGAGHRRVPLPTYPFERKRFWIEPGSTLYAEGVDHDPLARKSDPVDWFYHGSWVETEPPAAYTLRSVLVLCDGIAQQRKLIDRLGAAAARLIVAGRDNEAGELSPSLIHGTGEADFRALLESVDDLDLVVSVPATEDADADLGAQIAQSRERFDTLLRFGRALAESTETQKPLRLVVVGRQSVQVADEPVCPGDALLHGPCRVLQGEIEALTSRFIDVPSGFATSHPECLAALVDDIISVSPDPLTAWRSDRRFVHRFEPLHDTGIRSRKRGATDRPVILITGGLGGLGLEAARVVASAEAVIVLLGRSDFPDEAGWEQWLQNHGPQEPVSKKILAIRAAQSAGARVVIEAADVADADRLAAVVTRVEEQWGPISGIIHTAGHLEDALLQMKEPEVVDRVLRAKVYGTLAIDRVFRDRDLDFYLLYSSISAFSGMPGQFDYAAANSFLDAYAVHCPPRMNARSVAWAAWKETGMAADRASGVRFHAPASGDPVAHPMLDRKLATDPPEYATSFSTTSSWVLNEHRLANGRAIMPGTGYLEFARAAFCDFVPTESLTFRDVSFFIPFALDEGLATELRIRFKAHDARWSFEVVSRDAQSPETEEWIVHATGSLEAGAEPVTEEGASHASLSSRCSAGRQRFSDPEHHPDLQLGRRWEAMESARLGEKEALIDLQLDEDCVADLQDYRLHPALLDLATAGAQAINPRYRPGENFFVPVGYQRLRLFGPFTRSAYSHVRLRDADETGRCRYDVSIYDTSGRLLCAVEAFSMQEVANKDLNESSTDSRQPGTVLADLLELGIDSRDGETALAHLLSGSRPRHVIVATRDLDALVAEQRRLTGAPGRPTPSTTSVLVEDPDLIEVERILVDVDGVAGAVVNRYARGDDSQVVAFIRWEEPEGSNPKKLRRLLLNRVRRDLLPDEFTTITEFPLDSGGVIDRTALDNPFDAQASGRDALVSTPYRAPETETEKLVTGIWEDMLGIPGIGTDDNFFGLGGHSLLLIRVATRLKQRLGADLPLDQVFESPTVANIAAIMDEHRQHDKQAPQRPKLKRVDRTQYRIGS